MKASTNAQGGNLHFTHGNHHVGGNLLYTGPMQIAGGGGALKPSKFSPVILASGSILHANEDIDFLLNRESLESKQKTLQKNESEVFNINRSVVSKIKGDENLRVSLQSAGTFRRTIDGQIDVY